MSGLAPINEQKEQYLAARVSIVASIIMFLVSAAIGLITDSVTLILDASASLVILVVGFLMHFSIKKIHLPPDDSYHFGYYKYEPLTAAIQNGLIIVVCIVSIKFAIQDIIHADDMANYSLAAFGIFFELILSLGIAFYLKNMAAKTKSQMIRASGTHWLLDAGLSLGICVGFCIAIIMKDTSWARLTPYVDPVMAMLLASFFIFVPIRGGMHNLFELLDAAPDAHIRDNVKQIIEKFIPAGFKLEHIKIRKAGQKIFINICFTVLEKLSLEQATMAVNDFESNLKANLPECDAVVYLKYAGIAQGKTGEAYIGI